MKKINLQDVNEDMVVKHEELYLKTVQEIVNQFQEKFNDLGLTLCCSLFWENMIQNKVSETRLCLENGYCSYVHIEARKGNKRVLLNDGEYGQISIADSVVYVERTLLLKSYVIFTDDTDDVSNDLEEDYQLVTEHGYVEWEES